MSAPRNSIQHRHRPELATSARCCPLPDIQDEENYRTQNGTHHLDFRHFLAIRHNQQIAEPGVVATQPKVCSGSMVHVRTEECFNIVTAFDWML
jgi:hypothetical protein